MIVLVYPAKGIVNKDGTAKCERAYSALLDEGISIFKSIFENNNKFLIEKFFTNSLIRRLWPLVVQNLNYNYCFLNGHNETIMDSYRAVSQKVKSYNL